MNRGILYICHGTKYLNELFMSAQSVKIACGDIPITVFTDANISSEFIDDVRKIDLKSNRSKVYYMYDSPYDETIFLDTDVIAVRDFKDMFGLLEKFDIGIAHDLARKREKYSNVMSEYKDIPYAFSEVNTGIITFRKNEQVKDLFDLWQSFYEKYYALCPYDQPSFRISLWRSVVKTYILPVEYNIRSLANRQKQIKFHHEFGDEHLAPRMYHMHHGGFDLDTATRNCIKNAQPY